MWPFVARGSQSSTGSGAGDQQGNPGCNRRRVRFPLAPLSLDSAALLEMACPSTRTQLSGLNDVSFEIKRGDVIGIIGRNGGGKSTLLKILSCITEPTRDNADICGRVGSLLDVGTGFHPELTGRDNIFLNGAILGVRRTEVARNFDEIVAFAELEKFIDTPVKAAACATLVLRLFARTLGKIQMSRQVLVTFGSSAHAQRRP
jgi:ABC-type polysaccharide/polyol phosphate transport system ATPase subunit